MIMHPVNLDVGAPGGADIRGIPGITGTEDGTLPIGLARHIAQAVYGTPLANFHSAILLKSVSANFP
jgi:hypothetical protein